MSKLNHLLGSFHKLNKAHEAVIAAGEKRMHVDAVNRALVELGASQPIQYTPTRSSEGGRSELTIHFNLMAARKLLTALYAEHLVDTGAETRPALVAKIKEACDGLAITFEEGADTFTYVLPGDDRMEIIRHLEMIYREDFDKYHTMRAAMPNAITTNPQENPND